MKFAKLFKHSNKTQLNLLVIITSFFLSLSNGFCQTDSSICFYFQLTDVWKSKENWNFNLTNHDTELIISKGLQSYSITSKSHKKATIAFFKNEFIAISISKQDSNRNILFEIKKHSFLKNELMQVSISNLDESAFAQINFKRTETETDIKRGLRSNWYKATFAENVLIEGKAIPNITCILNETCLANLTETQEKKQFDAEKARMEAERAYNKKQKKLKELHAALHKEADSAMVHCFGMHRFEKNINLVSAVSDCNENKALIKSLGDDTTCEKAIFIYKFSDKKSDLVFFSHLAVTLQGEVKLKKGVYSHQALADSLFQFFNMDHLRDSIKKSFSVFPMEMQDDKIKLSLIYQTRDPILEFLRQYSPNDTDYYDKEWKPRFMVYTKQRAFNPNKEKHNPSYFYAGSNTEVYYFDARTGKFFKRYSY